ncbi:MULTISPECIES: hypothetical protein [unclassified Bosea (in: a-proteobacteria)]|uniref:hypothetical protein n=1 Tax=unclassified Bosea (in: a-proteobacteria) TaxID=2653178 RepID=UPI000F751ABC|nr:MULTISPECIES: hypothetical protein [unclassified Bosea (in: a-proteobacteria)]AZO77457.1 hypothetical protein BLM15_07420 [Bosea sp. Tri-49]RXT18063.1 hypothetical protein B5U98_22575 [Bosea sp. Tri-39]RXT32661.1 hypothetical protein B5U99_28920 [Bosea sp. Tri-54]
MTDPSALSTENIIGTLIAGIGIGIYALREYFKTRKAPASTQNGDRMIPGITIADMQPIRDLKDEQAKTTAAVVRVADALEGLLELTRERAADEEIMRRAEILAQQMLKQLPGAKGATRSSR